MLFTRVLHDAAALDEPVITLHLSSYSRPIVLDPKFKDESFLMRKGVSLDERLSALATL
jgi:hypothetical protein